jgi:hypothetical protein
MTEKSMRRRPAAALGTGAPADDAPIDRKRDENVDRPVSLCAIASLLHEVNDAAARVVRNSEMLKERFDQIANGLVEAYERAGETVSAVRRLID